MKEQIAMNQLLDEHLLKTIRGFKESNYNDLVSYLKLDFLKHQDKLKEYLKHNYDGTYKLDNDNDYINLYIELACDV